jgi:glucose-1-phosphate thymidylyltransferase
MKGLVLAGGLGTRLRPFSHSMPKQLVPVANKPVLLHVLDALREAGVTDVGIVVGDRAAAIRAAVPAQGGSGLAVTYLHQPAPLGLAHAVAVARDFLADDEFVMYLGDNIVVGGIAPFAETFRRDRPAAQLVLTKVPDPQRYGVAEVDGHGAVTALAEKPAKPRSDLAIMGVYFLTPAIHEAIAQIAPSQRGELEITDAVQRLVDQGRPVRGERFEGFWRDTGTVDDVLECNQHLLDALPARVLGGVDGDSQLTGPVDVAPGAQITRSRVIGPVMLGAGTRVEDSVIGPYTTIGAGCAVSRCGVEYSMLLDGACLRGVPGIHHSLIGRAAEVELGHDATGRRQRLILGDHGRVVLGA